MINISNTYLPTSQSLINLYLVNITLSKYKIRRNTTT